MFLLSAVPHQQTHSHSICTRETHKACVFVRALLTTGRFSVVEWSFSLLACSSHCSRGVCGVVAFGLTTQLTDFCFDSSFLSIKLLSIKRKAFINFVKIQYFIDNAVLNA